MGQLSVGGVSAQFRPVLALLTESGTYTVPYAGWYRIAAVGPGAGGYGDDSDPLSTPAPGGAGGGGYLDKYLPAGAVLTATISDMAHTLLRRERFDLRRQRQRQDVGGRYRLWRGGIS